MNDTFICVPPAEHDDVHEHVYRVIAGPGNERNFVYRVQPVRSRDGSMVVAVRQHGLHVPKGRYDFNLRASVQISKPFSNKKVVPTDDDVAERWLATRLTQNGAIPHLVAVIERGMIRRQGRPGLPYIDFGGEFEVVDDELFSCFAAKGVGKAKAYGCGLIEFTPTA